MNAQQMSRRTFLKAAGSTFSLALLAACVAPAQSPAGGGAAAPAEAPIVIRFGRHDPGQGATVTIKQFEEMYPNLKVEMEQIGEFDTKIYALAAAGTLPDVVRSWEAMALAMGRNGQFIDLQPFVDTQEDFNAEDFVENWWNYPVVDGKRVGIPDVAATHVTYYNVALFDQKGVEYPDPENFTWNDFEEKARALSDPDNQIWGSETIPVGWHYYTLKQIWQNGGDFYSEDYKTCVVDQPAAIEAVQFWADLLLDGNIMPSPSQIIGMGGAGAAAELMGAGKIAMQRMGSWITGDLMDRGIVFNIVPEPSMVDRVTISHGGINAIASTSPYPQEAWMWINVNCSAQGIYNYALDGKFPGARRSTNEIEPHPWVADVDFEVNWDIIPQSVEYGRVLPGPCNELEALKPIGDALERIYGGDAKAADLFPEIAPRVTELLQEC
jgi:multiple sugar transport system substrate-binding protein